MADLDAILNGFVDSDIVVAASDISRSSASREWLKERIKVQISTRNAEPRLEPSELFVHYGS